MSASLPGNAQQVIRTGGFDLPCDADTAFPLFSPEGERECVNAMVSGTRNNNHRRGSRSRQSTSSSPGGKCATQQRKRLQLQIELNACVRHFAGLMSSRNP
jgi:hypothetical protein